MVALPLLSETEDNGEMLPYRRGVSLKLGLWDEGDVSVAEMSKGFGEDIASGVVLLVGAGDVTSVVRAYDKRVGGSKRTRGMGQHALVRRLM